MTDFTAPPLARAVPLPRLYRIGAAGLALVVLSDWLFYGRGLGISAAIFAAATAVAIILAHAGKAERRERLIGAGLLIIALLPLIEDVNPLSIGFGFAGVGAFALICAGGWRGSLLARLWAIADLYVAGPFRLAPQALRGSLLLATGGAGRWGGGLVAWTIPLLLGGVFLMLFASANPLIERWLTVLDPEAAVQTLSLRRFALWLMVVALTAPLLYVTWRKAAAPKAEDQVDPEAQPGRLRALFLSDAAILRSLGLFNLIFAVQTATDLVYLWGGVALPGGMTYAAYAHRGAYPLIATALLAAGFVLVALRPGSTAQGSQSIRWLVYLWIGQNVLLVISSILRLDLYVAVYSLTMLRVAAFIWMVLVAIGLVLIVARIALRRGNGWLVQANLVAAGIMLYGCGLTNFAAIIADYNVMHSRQISGQGVNLDMHYLSRLGPQAIPALDRFIALRAAMPDAQGYDLPTQSARIRRAALAFRAQARRSDWRRWTFRQDRLWRYLAAHQDAIPASPPAEEPAPDGS